MTEPVSGSAAQPRSTDKEPCRCDRVERRGKFVRVTDPDGATRGWWECQTCGGTYFALMGSA